MIGATKSTAADAGAAKFEPPALNGEGSARGGKGTAAVATYASVETDSLHMQYTSKDGDVVEVDWEHREEVLAGVGFAKDAPAGANVSAAQVSADKGRAEAAMAGANAEAAQPATSADARLEQLARVRDWATQVADEVRKQQKHILEESLKRSGKFMAGGDGRFILIYAAADQTSSAAANGNGENGENGIPEYWNAENTSDRIVKFATQMAQIAGNDSDFAKTIVKAVADGFDQANAASGPLPGAAGELNKKTRELTFSKLSEWLDDRKSMGYNQGALNESIPNPDTTHGSENHEQ
jgi:hypothetical protein